MGNEAFAYAALEAGVRVVAGYPGTPSSEVIETVAKLHASGVARGVHIEWSTNEKSALELLAGASYAGARCLFTCKQVGLNVASDPLMSLNYVGVKGGMVLLVADDPGPISSQTEQDTRRFASFAKVPVLDPSTPDEGFAMMRAAFDLSERYHTPVIVRPTTRIDHASTFFDVPDATDALPVPPEGFERDAKWVIFPRRAYQAHGEINERLPRIAHDFAQDPVLAAFNPIFEGGEKFFVGGEPSRGDSHVDAENGTDVSRETSEEPSKDRFDKREVAPHPSRSEEGRTPARLGIVAGGVSAAYVREALKELEKRASAQSVQLPSYRFLQIGTPYPFPEERVAPFVEGLDEVLVIEELDHVLEDGLLAFAGRVHATFDVRGRLTGDARDRGENDVDDVMVRIAVFLGMPSAVADIDSVRYEAPAGDPLPVRPPVLCAGCPHRGSFYAVKRALGTTPAVLCGDIGCYTLGNAQPLDAVDTCLCMGAGITMAQGFAVAEPEKKHVAFVGDSTFFASGLPGIVNAVYNGHDVTVCVLDNATTAMTGAQPHPGTGVTLMGPKRPPVSIERVLEAVGFECILHADPLDLDGSVKAASEALSFAGPSAILFESPCVQLVSPKAPVVVDDETCTGCKKCITEIGCPGVCFNADARGPRSRDRGQVFIDTGLCNGCGLCVSLCPFGALSIPGCDREGPAEVSQAVPASENSGARQAEPVEAEKGESRA